MRMKAGLPHEWWSEASGCERFLRKVRARIEPEGRTPYELRQAASMAGGWCLSGRRYRTSQRRRWKPRPHWSSIAACAKAFCHDTTYTPGGWFGDYMVIGEEMNATAPRHCDAHARCHLGAWETKRTRHTNANGFEGSRLMSVSPRTVRSTHGGGSSSSSFSPSSVQSGANGSSAESGSTEPRKTKRPLTPTL